MSEITHPTDPIVKDWQAGRDPDPALEALAAALDAALAVRARVRQRAEACEAALAGLDAQLAAAEGKTYDKLLAERVARTSEAASLPGQTAAANGAVRTARRAWLEAVQAAARAEADRIVEETTAADRELGEITLLLNRQASMPVAYRLAPGDWAAKTARVGELTDWLWPRRERLEVCRRVLYGASDGLRAAA